MLIFVPSSIYINLTTKIMIKKKDKKSKYPDYIEVSAIDKVISEGKDPIEMMKEMKPGQLHEICRICSCLMKIVFVVKNFENSIADI